MVCPLNFFFFFLQSDWMNVKVKVTPLRLTLLDPIDCTIHGILQARILEWVIVPFSRRSFLPGDQTQLSHIASGFFTSWATREAIYIHDPQLAGTVDQLKTDPELTELLEWVGNDFKDNIVTLFYTFKLDIENINMCKLKF